MGELYTNNIGDLHTHARAHALTRTKLQTHTHMSNLFCFLFQFAVVLHRVDSWQSSQTDERKPLKQLTRISNKLRVSVLVFITFDVQRRPKCFPSPFFKIQNNAAAGVGVGSVNFHTDFVVVFLVSVLLIAFKRTLQTSDCSVRLRGVEFLWKRV